MRHLVVISAFLYFRAPGCYGWQAAQVPEPTSAAANSTAGEPTKQHPEISDILGLDVSLALRPSQGLNPFAPNRLLMIGEDGLLRTVEGGPTACVTADGHSVPCLIGSGGDVTARTSAQGVATGPAKSSSVTYTARTGPAGGIAPTLGGSAGKLSLPPLALVSCSASGASYLTCNIANSNLNIAATTGQAPHQVIGTCGSNTSFGPCQATGADINYTASGTGAVTRTVQSKLRDTVSVMDFWATGNGVTDDTAAINAAITAVYAGPQGGAIYLPCGTYLVSGLTMRGQISPLKALSIVGESKSCVVLLANANNETILTAAYNSHIADLTVACNGYSGGTGINFIASEAMVSNVQASNCQYGYSFLGTNDDGPATNSLYDAYAVSDAYGVYINQNPLGMDWPNLNEFFHYVARFCTSAAFYISGGDGNVCYGCDIEANSGYGIEILNGQGDQFHGGWLEDNTLGNLVIAPTGHPAPSGIIVDMFGTNAWQSPWTSICSASTNAPYTVTVYSAAGISLGQSIYVPRAGPSATGLYSWITGISGTTLTIKDAISTTTSGYNCTRAPVGARVSGESLMDFETGVTLQNPTINSLTWGTESGSALMVQTCGATAGHGIYLQDSGGKPHTRDPM